MTTSSTLPINASASTKTAIIINNKGPTISYINCMSRKWDIETCEGGASGSSGHCCCCCSCGWRHTCRRSTTTTIRNK